MSRLHDTSLWKMLREGGRRLDEALQDLCSAAVETVSGKVAPLQDWYDDYLDRRGRDLIDQTLHVLGWGVLAAVGTAAAAWAVAHHREFVRQAPIERIEDTERDMRFMMIGAVIGQVVHTTWTTCLAIKLVSAAAATWAPTPILLP